MAKHTDAEAFAILEQATGDIATNTNGTVETAVAAKTEIPVAPEGFEERTVKLLPGFSFQDIKQRHLMAFYEHYDPSTEHPSTFHFNTHIIDAAIKAGWFKSPKDFDTLDMEWRDVETLRTAVSDHLYNIVNTPKK